MAGRPLLPAAVAGLALAALVHGVYDFFALRADAWARVLPPAIVLAVYVWRMALLRRLSSGSSRNRLHATASRCWNFGAIVGGSTG